MNNAGVIGGIDVYGRGIGDNRVGLDRRFKDGVYVSVRSGKADQGRVRACRREREKEMAVDRHLCAFLFEEAESGLPDRFEPTTRRRELESNSGAGQINLDDVHAHASRRVFRARNDGDTRERTIDNLGGSEFRTANANRQQSL